MRKFIKGGVPLTDPLSSTTFNGIDTTLHVFSSSKNYVIGPMVELNLPFGLSVEADALYRPLDLTTDTQVIPMNTFTRRSVDIPSMEFPILLKAHFPHTPIVKPYVEAGPTFVSWQRRCLFVEQRLRARCWVGRQGPAGSDRSRASLFTLVIRQFIAITQR